MCLTFEAGLYECRSGPFSTVSTGSFDIFLTDTLEDFSDRLSDRPSERALAAFSVLDSEGLSRNNGNDSNNYL